MPFSASNPTYNKYRYLIGAKNNETYWDTNWAVEVDFGEGGAGDWIEGGVIVQEKFSDYRALDVVTEPREAVPAYMLTNHTLPGAGMQWSQVLYIVVLNRNVTTNWIDNGDFTVRASMEGGTLLSVRWDWMDQNSTNKWSKPSQTYRYRRSYLPSGLDEVNTFGEPVLVHKMKLRGRGREFRLFFESDGHKDSHIEGWSYQGYILNGV